MIDQIDGLSMDIEQTNLDKLRSVFPECVSEGKLDIDKLLSLCGEYIDNKGYSNPDNDPRGPWVAGDLTVGMNADMRPNQYYDLVDPKTGKVYHPSYNRVWSYAPDSMQKLIEEDRIVFPEDTSQRPMKKRFANELKSDANPFSTWMSEVGLNTEGTRAVYTLFDDKSLFNYAKPISLIKTIVSQVTSQDDIVLDFFSGSATTAHAVMQLNAEDGGNRRFILVQLPELCDEKSEAYKAGYKNICEIGKERIRRAGKKIHQDLGMSAAFDLATAITIPELEDEMNESCEQKILNYDDNRISDYCMAGIRSF